MMIIEDSSTSNEEMVAARSFSKCLSEIPLSFRTKLFVQHQTFLAFPSTKYMHVPCITAAVISRTSEWLRASGMKFYKISFQIT